MKKTFVSGGTGFIGSNLAKELLDQGCEVTITGTKTEQAVKGAKFLQVHLDGIEWRKVLDQDVVFHQAANNDTLDQDKEEMWKANVYASKELFFTANRGGCQKFVYASSTAVYGDAEPPYNEDTTMPSPLNVYGESKLRLDELAEVFYGQQKPETVVGLRYCNVYGPGEEHKGKRASMIGQLIQRMMKGLRPKIFRDGEQKRDWIFVKDVVRANLLASEYKGFGVFNCGYGEAVTFNELVRIINKTIGRKLQPIYIDCPFADRYQNFTQCDMSKAKKELGFVPEYDVEKGIYEYVDYLRKKRSSE